MYKKITKIGMIIGSILAIIGVFLVNLSLFNANYNYLKYSGDITIFGLLILSLSALLHIEPLDYDNR
jgi:hypothetical protein